MTITATQPGGMALYREQGGRAAWSGGPPPVNANVAWAADYGREIKAIIERQAARAPRSNQLHLGPSELGETCDLQVIGKMVGPGKMPATNHVPSPWPSIVGTAVHAWLATAMEDENARIGVQRFLTEMRVAPMPEHPGTTDMFDTIAMITGDWKGVHIHTPIATPGGWTTMGQLSPGDTIFGADGQPCRVTKTYPVTEGRDCYQITFDDGSSLVTDDVQEWKIDHGYGSARKTVLMSTAEMADQVHTSWARPQRQLRLHNGGSLNLPPQDLIVHPYVLGCWLGDGGTHGGTIGTHEDDAEELFGHIRDCGYKISEPYGQRKFVRNIYGLSTQLRQLGLQWIYTGPLTGSHGRLDGRKVIPDAYLRGSYEQRLSLLQGLMDTDGTWNKTRNQAVFTSVAKDLALQVAELVTSLGWKAKVYPHKARGFGISTTEYMTVFTPYGANPFRLGRKAALVRIQGATKSRYRMVYSVEPVPSVLTRCIDVDSSDHLYLAGTEMLPVHNCLGPTSMAKIQSPDGPPRVYKVQLLLYWLGCRLAGYDARRIALIALPRTAPSLDGMYVWGCEPGPEEIALLQEVIRVTAVRRQIAVEILKGTMHLSQVPITPDPNSCWYCPFWRPQSAKDGGPGCPGTSR
jgi:LAGLIDADG DNA endonuclease family protein